MRRRDAHVRRPSGVASYRSERAESAAGGQLLARYAVQKSFMRVTWPGVNCVMQLSYV